MLGMKNTMIFGFGGSQFVWGDHYGTSSFQCNMPSDIIETDTKNHRSREKTETASV